MVWTEVEYNVVKLIGVVAHLELVHEHELWIIPHVVSLDCEHVLYCTSKI